MNRGRSFTAAFCCAIMVISGTSIAAQAEDAGTDIGAEEPEKLQSEDGIYLYYSDGVFAGYLGDAETDTLEIPKEIDGTPITKIGAKAMERQASIRYLAIPDSITEIGENAFAEMSQLETVNIPASVEKIGKNAFLNSTLERVEISADSTAFEDAVFMNCEDISQVVFTKEAKWTQVPADTFFGCSSLEKITLPSDVVKIGDNAFAQSGLKEITLSSKLKTIEDNAFARTKIKEITLPDTIRKIDDGAFKNSDLEKIEWPSTVATMPDAVFAGCSDLKEIIIPSGVSAIGEWALDTGTETTIYNSSKLEFRGADKQREVDAQYLKSSTSLTVYAPLTIDLSLQGKVLVEGKSVSKGDTAYYRGDICVSAALGYMIDTLYLDMNRLKGGESYHFSMPNVPVRLAGSVKAIPKAPETGDAEGDKDIDKDTGGKTPPVASGSTDTSVKKGTKIKDTASKAYYQVTSTGKTCTVSYLYPTKKNQKTVTIPSKIKISGKNYQVTAIAKNAFKNHTKMTKITIPSTVTTIGDAAFYGCKSLKSVTIPQNVKKIGKKAFYNDKKLTKLIVKSKKLKTVGKDALKNVNSKITIKVPKSKYKSYQMLFKGKGIKKTAKFIKM